MKLQGLYDPTNPDLKAFAARGGKLVMWHGWADTGSSPLGSLNYAEAVRAHLGEQAAGDVLSLYLVPGAYHCSGGPIPVTADYMSQLIAWVEDGRSPGEVKVSFEAGPEGCYRHEDNQCPTLLCRTRDQVGLEPYGMAGIG